MEMRIEDIFHHSEATPNLFMPHESWLEVELNFTVVIVTRSVESVLYPSAVMTIQQSLFTVS